MNPIFIHRDDERHGPYPWSDIRRLVEDGHFTWDDFAWQDGMETWEPLHAVYERLPLPLPPPSRQIEEEEEEPEPGFFRSLPHAFVYPFLGPNKWAVFFFCLIAAGVLSVISFAFIFGLVGSTLIHGYYYAYLFRVIQDSATGDNEAAEFPGIDNTWDGIFMPIFKVLLTILGCLLPAILALIFIPYEQLPDLEIIPTILLFGGLFYMPMAFLCLVMFNSVLDGLNPLIVIPAIFRIFLRYVTVVILIAATVFAYEYVQTLTQDRLNFFVARPLIQFVSLYLGIVVARILGLIYQTSADELGWFTR